MNTSPFGRPEWTPACHAPPSTHAHTISISVAPPWRTERIKHGVCVWAIKRYLIDLLPFPISSSAARRSSTSWPTRWWMSGPVSGSWSPSPGTRTTSTARSRCTTRVGLWPLPPRIATSPSTACWPGWPWRLVSTGSPTSVGVIYTAPSNQVIIYIFCILILCLGIENKLFKTQ